MAAPVTAVIPSLSRDRGRGPAGILPIATEFGLTLM
jgi:hypothetical protein